MTGSTANLASDLPPTPLSCPTEDLQFRQIDLACCTLTSTILIVDLSLVIHTLTLERHARSTCMGEKNGVYSSTDRNYSKTSVKGLSRSVCR